MPGIINPIEAFDTFQPALDSGAIEIHPCDTAPDLFAHMDYPDGENPRWTYVRLEDGKVSCMAVFVPADQHEGMNALQLGYVVLEDLRGQGRAKWIAKAALAEATAGMAAAGEDAFFLEVVTSADDIPAQSVAAAITGVTPTKIVDQLSGKPALQFMKLINCRST